MRLPALLTLALALASTAQAAVVDRIAAVVNDDVITLSEVYELGGETFIGPRCGGPGGDLSAAVPECLREAELQVLDSLILRALVRQELADLDLDVSEEDLDRTIDQLMRQNQIDDRELFGQMIEQATGLTWQAYREQLRDQVRDEKFKQLVVRPRVSVSEDEVRDFYNRSSRDVVSTPMRTLEGLALQVPADADAVDRHQAVELLASVAAAVNAGEMDWQQAIADYDSGLYAPVEGDMGTYEAQDLTPQFRGPIFDAEVGKVGAPIEIGRTIYLVKVVSAADDRDVAPFAQAAPQIRMQLYQQKVEEEVEQWYLQARRRAAVRVLL